MAIVDSIRTHFERDMSKPHHVFGAFGPGLRLLAALLPLLRRSRLPLPFGAAALWTALDVLRGRAAAVRNLRPLAVPGAAFAVALLLGALRLSSPLPQATLRVAAIQPAIGLQERATPRGEKATLERLERLTREAAKDRPALIAWPETSVRSLMERRDSFEWVQGLAAGTDATLIVGASQAEKFPGADGDSYLLRQNDLAVAFRPKGGEPSTYRKALLVPFAEYLPAPSFPWPKKLVGKSFDVVSGESPGLFRLSDGTPIAPGAGPTPFARGGRFFGAACVAAAAAAALDGARRRRDSSA